MIIGRADARALPLADRSVDAICTDPPYGLEFMGKDWDRFAGKVSDRDFKGFVLSQQRTRNVKCPECKRWAYDHPGRLCECGGITRAQGNAFQGWSEAWAAEALRVAKAGAFLLAFGGTRTYHRLTCAIEDAGWIVEDSIGVLGWVHAQGFPKGKNKLKPAWEPIVLARKRGPSVLSVDACRVGTDTSRGDRYNGKAPGGSHSMQIAGERSEPWDVPAGRWPPNLLIVHHPDCAQTCVPGCHVAELDAQSGNRPGAHPQRRFSPPSDSIFGLGGVNYRGIDKDGGASRFYPVFRFAAKAPTKERPVIVRDGLRHSHPTVKPLGLMRWLVRLVTPPGGTVLDPFCGSGATLEAARLEGFRAVGFDTDPDAMEWTAQRLGKHEPDLFAAL